MTEIYLAAGLGFYFLLLAGTLGILTRIEEMAEKLVAEPASGGLTARVFIGRVTEAENMDDLEVEEANSRTAGWYFPGRRLIKIPGRDGSSLLALAVAAHEVSHARHEARWESLMKTSNFLGLTGTLLAYSFPLFFLAGILYYPILIYIGAVLFVLLIILVGIELPIEIEATRTAMGYLRQYSGLEESELRQVKRILNWAILSRITYFTGGYLALLLIDKEEVK
ncbi:zinc metallopeptidase [Candidatus Bipolaricaulota bacterium]|nr:zinc metallopeptidase [Candidatus Bipolaricaulota bacterium]